MWRLASPLPLTIAITLMHFFSWSACCGWIVAHPEGYIFGPGVVDSVVCGGGKCGADGTPFDTPAMILFIVLSVPLAIPFGCLLLDISQPAAIFLGLVNSALWGVVFAFGFLELEKRLWKATKRWDC